LPSLLKAHAEENATRVSWLERLWWCRAEISANRKVEVELEGPWHSNAAVSSGEGVSKDCAYRDSVTANETRHRVLGVNDDVVSILEVACYPLLAFRFDKLSRHSRGNCHTGERSRGELRC
jgi:hypothetical protein